MTKNKSCQWFSQVFENPLTCVFSGIEKNLERVSNKVTTFVTLNNNSNQNYKRKIKQNEFLQDLYLMYAL
jgi:hypothetical protein